MIITMRDVFELKESTEMVLLGRSVMGRLNPELINGLCEAIEHQQKALKWYADKNRWNMIEPFKGEKSSLAFPDPTNETIEDHGEHARKSLLPEE